ncbi:plasma-membrane choline transporter-domain-containing protein, partial [Pavlovales sp. CCMP2436]
SVVFGSLIVAIVKYIRYMMHFVKKYITPENAVCGSFIKCIWCCIDCCLRCFEKLLEFISRNAYIIVAVESESFCTSARHAFGFLVSNLGGLAMVQVIGDSFLFLGKAFVALVSTGIAAIILTQSPWYNLNTTSIILPCTIVFIGAWMIGSLFMGIFEMCIDTIFMSFLIDEDKKLGFADGALKAFIADASKGKGEKVTSSTKGKATTSAPNVKPTVQA